ncbi:MAG: (2Fe-2S) ferredoxin domain-containing protein [Chloroflexi bacterium]|nr:(2Fe-2S) ferredoxin domain-containing protein [Chloroflexota bacterium]
MSDPINSYPKRKIFICSNGRCIDSSASRDIYAQLTSLIQEHGLDSFDAPRQVKCALSGCLDRCINGPVLVVHPDGIWYERVTPQALVEIFNEHLLHDQPVEKYIYKKSNPPVADKNLA